MKHLFEIRQACHYFEMASIDVSTDVTHTFGMQWLIVPRWQPQRIQMSFPITSKDTSAVAMVEAKKIWGRHLFKLLAVDVRCKAPLGSDTRIYIRGGPEDFEENGEHTSAGSGSRWWGGVKKENIVRGRVFEELREPLKRVMNARKVVDIEDEEDER
jgi:hypothetical protein